MSGLPSGISLLRHVPVHLVKGYGAGEYRLWGGVMRRAVQPGRGQIVGFLTEGWELTRQVEQNLPIRSEALKAALDNVQMASQMAMGIGVLNLGVQVAGFALVLKRLDRISRQIETVHSELRAIGQNVAWLTMASMAALRADAANAIVTAERAVRQGDRNLLNDAKTRGDRVRRHLSNLCGEMLVTGRALPQRAMFEEFMKLGVLIAYAEARCDESVEGAQQAAADLAVAAAELRHLSDSLAGQMQNFAQNPLELLRIGDAGRADTKALTVRVDDAVSRLEGYVPQLQMQHALGLDAAGWRKLIAPQGSGILTCLTFDGAPRGDLLEVVIEDRKAA